MLWTIRSDLVNREKETIKRDLGTLVRMGSCEEKVYGSMVHGS